MALVNCDIVFCMILIPAPKSGDEWLKADESALAASSAAAGRYVPVLGCPGPRFVELFAGTLKLCKVMAQTFRKEFKLPFFYIPLGVRYTSVMYYDVPYTL